MNEHEEELGVEMVPFRLMVYVQDRAEYMPVDEVPEGSARVPPNDGRRSSRRSIARADRSRPTISR